MFLDHKCFKLKSAGLSQGFIIVKINQKAVGTAEEVVELLNASKKTIQIQGYYPNGMMGQFMFGI